MLKIRLFVNNAADLQEALVLLEQYCLKYKLEVICQKQTGAI